MSISPPDPDAMYDESTLLPCIKWLREIAMYKPTRFPKISLIDIKERTENNVPGVEKISLRWFLMPEIIKTAFMESGLSLMAMSRVKAGAPEDIFKPASVA